MYPPGQSPRPAAPAGASVPAPAAKDAKDARRSPSAKPLREARPARFIAADSSATRVELGHDGQLPVLQLEEAARVETGGDGARASNPWLLVAALIFSFGMSAVLLFVDTDRAPAEKTTKRSARLEIEMHYTAPAAVPQRYRKLLREALQAYNKGDYATERQRYKEVLFLLHAENKDPLTGLTGQVKAANPPNDRHLEELLSTLVDD